MNSYLNYFKLRLATELQYRSAAIAGILTQVFFGFVYIMIYLAFYESNGNSPMPWKDLVTYLWLQQAFFSLTYPTIIDKEFVNIIKNGNLAYELIRPENYYIKYYVKFIARRLVRSLLKFSPIIIIGFLLPYPYKMSFPHSTTNFILFIISLFTSLILSNSLSLIVHLFIMFTMEERGIMGAYTVIAGLFMGSIVPLPLLPNIINKVAYLLPFRYIEDLPFRIYSNNIIIPNGIILILISLIWIIITTYLGYKLSKIALRKAVIQGG